MLFFVLVCLWCPRTAVCSTFCAARALLEKRVAAAESDPSFLPPVAMCVKFAHLERDKFRIFKRSYYIIYTYVTPRGRDDDRTKHLPSAGRPKQTTRANTKIPQGTLTFGGPRNIALRAILALCASKQSYSSSQLACRRNSDRLADDARTGRIAQ